MNKYSIGGIVVGAKGMEMLRGLDLEPLPLDGLSGHQKRTLLGLADKGLVTSDKTQAMLTQNGRALFDDSAPDEAAKVPGKMPPPNPMSGASTPPAPGRAAQPRTVATSQPTPPLPGERGNGAGGSAPARPVDLVALRAKIQARYENDLACVDRLEEIATAVGA